MKRKYELIRVVPLSVGPCEGVCGGSAKVAVKTTGQKAEEIWLNEKDPETGEYIYNNTWEEAN